MRRYPIKPWGKRSGLEKILGKFKYLKIVYGTFQWIILKIRGKASLSFSHWTLIGIREIRFQLGINNSSIAKKKKEVKK
jgi:hypothetical protein